MKRRVEPARLFHLHGSGTNRSNGLRRSFATHMWTEYSRPVNDERQGLDRHIDGLSKCPEINES